MRPECVICASSHWMLLSGWSKPPVQAVRLFGLQANYQDLWPALRSLGVQCVSLQTGDLKGQPPMESCEDVSGFSQVLLVASGAERKANALDVPGPIRCDPKKSRCGLIVRRRRLVIFENQAFTLGG